MALMTAGHSLKVDSHHIVMQHCSLLNYAAKFLKLAIFTCRLLYFFTKIFEQAEI